MIRPAAPEDRPRLFEIWREAVRATHHFLSDAEIEALAPDVLGWLDQPGERLVAVEDGRVVGFIGMDERLVEALFVAPDAHGRGHGRALLEAVADRGRLVLDVNEGNPGAVAFYRRMGFEATGRADVDAAGRPYPVLHMRGPAELPARTPNPVDPA